MVIEMRADDTAGIFSFIPDKLDFTDDNQYDSLRDSMYATLPEILKDERYTVELLEQFLFVTQSWIQPLAEQILSLNSLQDFSGLKAAAGRIYENYKNNNPRPYPGLEEYCNMCNVIGSIVGEYDETSQLSKEEVDLLRESFYNETEPKDNFCKEVAYYYSYSVFESLYYFIDYFTGESVREDAAHMVQFMTDNILFGVLWYLEQEPEKMPGQTGFMEAAGQLLEFLK